MLISESDYNGIDCESKEELVDYWDNFLNPENPINMIFGANIYFLKGNYIEIKNSENEDVIIIKSKDDWNEYIK